MVGKSSSENIKFQVEGFSQEVTTLPPVTYWIQEPDTK